MWSRYVEKERGVTAAGQASAPVRMTEAEQALAMLAGAALGLWALRHGRLLPSIALAVAAPLLAAGWSRRWPAMLAPPARDGRDGRRLPS